jgi:hypothetical protein
MFLNGLDIQVFRRDSSTAVPSLKLLRVTIEMRQQFQGRSANLTLLMEEDSFCSIPEPTLLYAAKYAPAEGKKAHYEEGR